MRCPPWRCSARATAGKTARARAAGQADDALYLDLESEQDRAKLAEPELYLTDHLDRLWLRGGFPESFLAPSDARSLRWRQDFIRSYLERDIPQFGPRIPAERLRRFVVYPGGEAYPTGQDVLAIPLLELARMLAEAGA